MILARVLGRLGAILGAGVRQDAPKTAETRRERRRGGGGIDADFLVETFFEGVDDVDGQDGRTGSSDVSLDTPGTRW